MEPVPPTSMGPSSRAAPVMVLLVASTSALPAEVAAIAELAMLAIPETMASLEMLRPASRLRPFAVFRLPLPRAAPVTLLLAAEEPKSTWPAIVPMPPIVVVPSNSAPSRVPPSA